MWNFLATISTQVMAHLRKIENLPNELLSEILVRVASAPDGAAEIARIFTVSKTFRQFSEDKDVQRSISMEALLAWKSYPCVRQYEDLLEVGGLVTKSAVAGNPIAQILLSKVIMISASTMLNEGKETSTPSVGDKKFFDSTRASLFLAHFADRKILFDMIKVFISKATLNEVKLMEQYIQDFVAYFLGSGRETDFDQFLISLVKYIHEPPYKNKLEFRPLAYFVQKFNYLCTEGHSTLQIVEVSQEQQQALLRCFVQPDEPVEFETLLQRLRTMRRLIALPSGTIRYPEVRHTTRTLLFKATLLRVDLHLKVCIQKDREVLLSKYNALFYL